MQGHWNRGGGDNGDICSHTFLFYKLPNPQGINMYSRNTVYEEISFAEGKSERIFVVFADHQVEYIVFLSHCFFFEYSSFTLLQQND